MNKFPLFIFYFFISILTFSSASIVDLAIIQGERQKCPDGYVKTPTTFNGDFNRGAGGDFIYLCVKYFSSENNPSDRITKLTVVAEQDYNCGNLGATRITTSYGSNGDFNEGSGGKYIYICYEKNSDDIPIDNLKIINEDSGNCPSGYSRISEAAGSNGDFNQGAGGDYIWLCYSQGCKPSDISGTWKTITILPVQEQFTYTYGTRTSTTKQQSNEWSQSVGVEMSEGFDFEGISASMKITEQFSKTISSSFTQVFETYTEQKTTATFPAGVVWQFQVNVADTCGAANANGLFLAVTENATQQPCCLPGYGKQTGNPYTQYLECIDGSPNICQQNFTKSIEASKFLTQ